MEPYVDNLIGGALIGLSASAMLLTLGRVAGISGILSGALFLGRAESRWRILFLLGLLFGGALLVVLGEFQFDAPENRTLWAVGFGGLLVGFGTSLGSGCTSGHGVCGISRLSPRSIAATVFFMFSGFVVTYVIEHLWGGI